MTTLRNIIFGAASLTALAVASSASAQASASATGTASVTIIAPITLTKNVDLVFGSVVKDGTAAATVVMPASASPTPVPTGATLVINQSAARTAAKFTAGGTATQTYSITLPSSAVTLTGTTAGLTVDTFTKSVATGSIGDGGFYVGATLNLPSGAIAAGSYTGNFDVTVAYN